MNLLIVISREGAVEDSLTAYEFALQLPDPDQVTVMAPVLPLALWAQSPFRHTRMLEANLDQRRFLADVSALDPDLILVADGPSLIAGAEDARIPWSWFPATKRPLALLDHLGACRKGALGENNPLVPVIEACPPNRDGQLLPWRRLDPMQLLAKHGQRENLRQSLGTSSETRIVLFALNLPQVVLASNQGWAIHYPQVIRVLAHYLNQLPGQTRLLVAGLPANLSWPEFANVRIHALAATTAEQLHEATLACDLLVVESMTHPLLLMARQSCIPSMVLGNQQTPHSISHLTGIPREAAEELAKVGALFPFVSFPFASAHWTNEQPVNGRFRFYLADLLDEMTAFPLLQQALASPPPANTKAAHGWTAPELLQKLTGLD